MADDPNVIQISNNTDRLVRLLLEQNGLLKQIVERLPEPKADEAKPLKTLGAKRTPNA
jgi:hypothetical protein